MKGFKWGAVFFLVGMVSATALAKGDPVAGEKKAAQCVACHGENGASTNVLWPKLAGQQASYIVKQLKAFKAGPETGRVGPMMYPIALNLTVQDMEDLGAYFASLPASLGKAKADLVTLGQALYRGGDMDKKIPACMACHGPKGKGNGPAGFPAVQGQHMQYSLAQLKAFSSGKRNNPSGMMKDISQLMNESQMLAVSSYMEGLR